VIAWLSGPVLHRHGSDGVVIDVSGVGYEVHVAHPEDLGTGDEAALFVHTVVRDDAIVLYGFTSSEEREFFDLLLATPGVGPSTALGALRTLSVAELAAAIESGDAKRVAQVPGIGLKTAGRIVLELKGKVVVDGSGAATAPPLRSEAIESALRALGYGAQEIRAALGEVTLPEDESEALRVALSHLRRP
jgi:holliday junction DNA helicase RuvA